MLEKKKRLGCGRRRRRTGGSPADTFWEKARGRGEKREEKGSITIKLNWRERDG